ncbi:hypothetical protein KKE60_08990 [Patescibacteria group bacterium]|nr:hypothetical protein [Patescibacteria group bacterium]
MIRYKVSEWSNILCVGQATFSSQPDFFLTLVTPGNPAPTLTNLLNPATNPPAVVFAGSTDMVCAWSMQQLSVAEALTVQAPSTQALYVWSMDQGVITASGAFMVHDVERNSHNIERFFYKLDDTAEDIHVIGNGFTRGTSVILYLYLYEPAVPSFTNIPLSTFNVCVELPSSYTTDSMTSYIWSSNSFVGASGDLENGVYYWLMVGSHGEKDSGFFIQGGYHSSMLIDIDEAASQSMTFGQSISDTQEDHTALLNSNTSKLNQLLQEQRKKESAFTYPGKGGK